nr:Asp-tRNA(Asn)/Glu-tRNA(Gln) amidotransferase subunit GatB [uncultured Lachnoclostridium sp.]
MKAYETVIGLEVHVELATKSKIFCGCTTQFGGEVNTHCCPVCMGMPGTLPVLNKKVVEFAIAAGLALNCEITRNCKFDRKNYFYPDLPKAYQVSQLYLPICRNGSIDIEVDGVKKSIGIHEIHMEEDAGKLVHDPWEDCTLVDYNRCGVPLIEIVSEPDMRSAEEVIAYLEKLKLILQYLGVSDCKMQEGSLRADINLSIREVGATEFGTRTEMKNMNSFKAIARAIEGERKRQIEVLEYGKKVIQETRRWDDNKDTSFAMRSKEDAQDYRYFPEPDLVPIEISEEWLTEIKRREPELRDAKMLRYVKEYEIPEYDAGIITGSKNLADIFEATVALCNKPKEVSNWIMVETMRLLKESEQEVEELKLSPAKFASLIELIDAGKINRTIAKEVFEQIFRSDVDPKTYIEEHGLGMVSDDGLLRSTIENILKENEQSVSDYKNGKEKAFGFLVGQTMKVMKGKANPSVINEILRELLSKV